MSRGVGRQEMVSSTRRTAASYSFGHGKRDIRKQQYMGACFDGLTKDTVPQSPAPCAYTLNESVGRQSLTGRPTTSEWRFGTADRSGRMYPDRAGRLPGPGAYNEHSSIGMQHLSKRPSSAKFGFGTGDRDVSAKLFISAQAARAAGLGANISPGPAGTSRENSDAIMSRGSCYSRPMSAASQQSGFGTEIRGARFLRTQDGPGPADYAVKEATFGVQPISVRETAPAFGFGTSDREMQSRVFVSESMAKNPASAGFGSAASPGPQYMQVSAFAKQPLTKGRSSASWGFGTAPRFKGNGGMRSVPGGVDSHYTPGPGAYNIVF